MENTTRGRVYLLDVQGIERNYNKANNSNKAKTGLKSNENVAFCKISRFRGETKTVTKSFHLIVLLFV